MLIDIASGKIIPNDPIITVTQSLTKSYDIVNNEGIDFINPENNNWNEIIINHNIITPEILIREFENTLKTILNNGNITPEYCKFMQECCKNWILSDQFMVIE